MLTLVSAYRLKTVASLGGTTGPLAALGTSPLAANGEIRMLIGDGFDNGVWVSLVDGSWSKLATSLDLNVTTGVIAAGATAVIVGAIPAQTIVLGVCVRVTVLPPGPATFSVGDGTDADRWGAGILVAAGTITNIADFTIASPVYYAAATNVVLTGNIAFAGGGTILARVHYQRIGNAGT